MIPTLAGGRAPFLSVSSSFVRVCVLLRKTRRWQLSEDGIRFSPSNPCFGGASSIVGGRVEVCLQHIHLWWICSDIVFVLDPSDLCYSSTAVVAVLMRSSYEALV